MVQWQNHRIENFVSVLCRRAPESDLFARGRLGTCFCFQCANNTYSRCFADSWVVWVVVGRSPLRLVPVGSTGAAAGADVCPQSAGAGPTGGATRRRLRFCSHATGQIRSERFSLSDTRFKNASEFRGMC